MASLEWQTNPIVYLPAPQAFSTIRDPTVRSFGFHVHVRADRTLSMAEIRRSVASLHSRVAVTEVTAASDTVAKATKQPAFRMALVAWFAVASLSLAAIGVYGLVAQGVARRRREIGIRLALGADASGVIGTVTRSAIAAALAGTIGGCVAALALANTLQSLLYGVRAADAASFFSAAVALLAVATIAAFVPALRATRIDPVQVLRAE